MRIVTDAQQWIDPLRKLSLVLVGIFLISACRATPPTPDEPPVEEPSSEPVERPTDSEESTIEGAEDDGIDDESGQEEEELPVEQVAAHVDARVKSALSLADDGDRSAAIRTLEDLVDEPEGGFLAAYNLGALYDRSGQISQATEWYEKTLNRQPDFTPALTNMIRLHLRVGDLSAAESAASRHVENRPNNLDHRATRLEVWIAQGRYEDAVEGARDVLRRDVRHVDAMVQMASANLELRRYELAEANLQRALQLSPDRAELYYILSLIAQAQDDDDGARANLRKAIELQPRFPEARNNYGVLLHDSGNYERAAEHLEAVVDDAPHYVEAWINLGNVYKAQGEYGLAEDAFRDALDIDNANGDAQFNLGILYLEAPVPGYEDIERLEASIEAFNAYRQIVGEREASSGPVASYINEAASAIEREESRQEMMRRAQMESGGAEDDEDEDEDAEEDDE